MHGSQIVGTLFNVWSQNWSKKFPSLLIFTIMCSLTPSFCIFLIGKSPYLTADLCSISNFSKLSPQKKCIFSMIEKMIKYIYIYIHFFSFDYRVFFQLKQDSTKGKVFIKPNRKSNKGQAHDMFSQILNLHFFFCSWNQKAKPPIHEFKVLQNVFKVFKMKKQGLK